MVTLFVEIVVSIRLWFCRFNIEESFDLTEFVKLCPMNLTGADFYALCSDAVLNAMKRKIKEFEGHNM